MMFLMVVMRVLIRATAIPIIRYRVSYQHCVITRLRLTVVIIPITVSIPTVTVTSDPIQA